MNKAAAAALAALALVFATSCGGDDADDELTATITANVAEAITTDDGILDAEAADCVAEKFVDELGATKLQEAKVVTEDGSYNDNGANVDAATSAVYAKALLACVDEEEATQKIEDTLIAGSVGSAIPASGAKCYVGKLVETVPIAQLLSSKIITDSGGLSENAAAPDPDTAAKSTEALLGCIDYYALDAKERASQTKGLSAAKYEACLKAKLPRETLAKFLTSVQAQADDQQTLGNRVNQTTAACVKSATKK